MKKGLIFLGFLLLVLPLMSAVQVDIKQEYKQGETLIAKVSGNFVQPILEKNIYLYRVNSPIPSTFHLIKIQEDYYLYTSLSNKNPGNYSIVIKNSEYYVLGGKTTTNPIKINFSISSDYADFSVIPGVLIANGSFNLQIQNLKDTPLTIYIDKNPIQENKSESGGFFSSLFGSSENKTQLSNDSFSINLRPGEIRQVQLSYEVENSTLEKIRLNTENFSTDVILYALANIVPPKEEIIRIDFDKESENLSMATNSNASLILILKNTGTADIDNITLNISDSFKDYVNISPVFIEDLEQNKSIQIILNITSKGKAETINGSIKAKTSNDTYAYADIILNILESYVPLTDNQTAPEVFSKTCNESGGKVCAIQKEICKGDSIKTSDQDSCCMGSCEVKTTSSSGKIAGWIIIFVLIILLIIFYFKKYKKTKKEADLLEVAEGKKKK